MCAITESPPYDVERATAVKALAQARRDLTTDHLEKFLHLGERRRTFEFRLLVDWYVLLQRSLAINAREDEP